MSKIADISEVLLQLGLSNSVTETERAIAQEAIRVATGAIVHYLQYDPSQATHIEFYPQADFRRSGREQIWEVNDTSAYVRQLAEAVTDELQLKHIPVRSITSLKIDYDGRFGKRAGSFGISTLKIEGADFWLQSESLDSNDNPVCNDGIVRSEGRWPDVPGSVKIEYVAGYTDKELHGQDTSIDASPILDAVIDESVRRVLKVNSRMKKRIGFVGPLTSENLGDYSYTVESGVFDRLVGGGMDLLPETEHKLAKFIKYDLGVA